jgi:enoyl-CoA hydratase
MDEDILIRVEGRAGRITLNRPGALNALTWEMCNRIEAALDAWAADDAVALMVIDAAGEKAFCAGGDIAEMYATAMTGDFDFGRRFWADEYRMNAKLFNFPKPVVSFLQGFTMGGGVGAGCHASHRIVCDTSRIAMPECGIGLIPDVGGSLILARAPGRLGEYLGSPRRGWGRATRSMRVRRLPRAAGDVGGAEGGADRDRRLGGGGPRRRPCPRSPARRPPGGDRRAFRGRWPARHPQRVAPRGDRLRGGHAAAMAKNSPLSMACAVDLIRRVRGRDTIEGALELEYRFTARAMEHGDFLEGIRAAIIDKDRTPRWRHDSMEAPTNREVSAMLLPLGADSLKL